MAIVEIKPAAGCHWDLVSLGEVMLRLDPGEGRITTTRRFTVWEGGGEYNVARGLKRCFGQRTAIVASLVDNPVGHLIEDLIYQGGVDQSHIRWVPGDGIGRSVRNGLNFTERGFGVRAPVGCSDRGHSAASQMKPGDVDWEKIFEEERTRWFHTGGIFAALSTTTPLVAREAMEAAGRAGTIVSYDLNFRPSIWAASGGSDKAQETARELVELADVVVGNEEDYLAALGRTLSTGGDDLLHLDDAAYGEMLAEVVRDFPRLKLAAVTLRRSLSATRNDWSALCHADGRTVRSIVREDLEVFDRVGGGDSFAAGLFYGLLAGHDLSRAVELGAAHGALAMTTPGDTSMVTLPEVERLAGGGAVRIIR